MIILFVTVDEITAVMAAGYTIIRVYTDTSESGAFTTLDGTITLVAGTESYSYTDVDGTEDTWYKTAYYGAGTGEGDKTAARKGQTSAAYATVKELRGQINMTGTTDDVELAALLDAATDAIDKAANRPEGFVAVPTAEARYYSGSGLAHQLIGECVAITEVAVKDSATDSDYTAWTTPSTDFAGDGDWIPFSGSPEAPLFNRLPYDGIMLDPNGDYDVFTSGRFTFRRGFRPTVSISRGVPTVRVTAKWGYAATVPKFIKEMCIIQAARWYKKGQSSHADMVASAELGILTFRKAELDSDLVGLLSRGRFIRPATGYE